MAVPAHKQDALEARLASLGQPEGARWATEARADARQRLQACGLPDRRDEYWKYTRPDEFVQAEVPNPLKVFHDHPDTFGKFNDVVVQFTDGVFDAKKSNYNRYGNIDGVEIELLQDAALADIHWAKDLYGTLEARGQSPVERPLATLNTATAEQGVLVNVTGGANVVIHLVYQNSASDSDAMIHNVIRVENGASVTVLESGVGAARSNFVLEVDVADGGQFHHLRDHSRTQCQRVVSHIFARLGAESVFKSFTLTLQGILTRNECVIELTGNDAKAHVAGAFVGDNDDCDFATHHDDTVFVTHDAENCESRQVFKKVLRNGAVGVFQGKILVKAGAQKTDGYQISQSLLLDDDSQFLAKPELEIYADDVVCSHGSTSGAIDEEALFYLRSRGVPESDAQDLMVLAFLAEALDEIEDETLAADVQSRLEAWFGDQQG